MALGNSTAKERKIDIIFCIDGTGSMSPCIEKVKANAKKFYQDFSTKMATDYNSVIEEVNIRVITFRDYLDDGKDAMVDSGRWFEMFAGDEVEYEKHINSIVAMGGGPSLEENGLEALFFAMTADWKAIGSDDRQVIVLFTDADALKLGERAGQGEYPADMVDEAGLLNTWMGVRPPFLGQDKFSLRERNKRLVLFAPSGTVYEQMQGQYNRCVFTPVEMSNGLEELSFDAIIQIIAASASSI